ncbi:hypothetical protein, partial [Bradyrhizobium sp.]
TEPPLIVASKCMLSAQERFTNQHTGEKIHALGAASIDQHNNYVGEIAYIGAAVEKFLEYFGSETASMENFRHRRIEY